MNNSAQSENGCDFPVRSIKWLEINMINMVPLSTLIQEMRSALQKPWGTSRKDTCHHSNRKKYHAVLQISRQYSWIPRTHQIHCSVLSCCETSTNVGLPSLAHSTALLATATRFCRRLADLPEHHPDFIMGK